jgi:hypothetical protein
MAVVGQMMPATVEKMMPAAVEKMMSAVVEKMTIVMMVAGIGKMMPMLEQK